MDWIVTSDVSRERWRRLREFANVDIAVSAIARRFGHPATASQHRNYEKQALQLRMCILQAEDYFAAARSSTAYTSPNHLYYGMVSLASAVMLLLGDGTRSFDYLRKDRRNMHHGLDFSVDADVAKADKGFGVLELARVQVANHGHFHAWHSVLPTLEPCFALVTRHFEDGTQTGMDEVGGETTAATHALVGRKFRVLDLVRRLPDLMGDLLRYGVAPACTRANYGIRWRDFGTEDRLYHEWRLHGAPSMDDFMDILEGFRVSQDLVQYVSVPDSFSAPSCIVNIETRSPTSRLHWPSSRYTVDLRMYMYADPIDTHEFVDFYMAAYGLSMLARYYPDLWRACLESHCLGSRLIESFIAVAIDKTPQLALSRLSGDAIVICTHRAPWQE
jgi:hypothetical protein